MPLLRRPYTGPYDHERRRTWPAALGALTALLVAGLIGWAIGNGRRERQRDANGDAHRHRRNAAVERLPSTQRNGSRRGRRSESGPGRDELRAEADRCQSPTAYSLGPDGGGLWSLAYRIKSYTPRIMPWYEAWQPSRSAAGGVAARSRWRWESR